MYINFWYPVVRSEDLAPGKPEKVNILGLNFVAFRDDEGKARVLSDTCCHRGGSLAGAWSSLESTPRIVNGWLALKEAPGLGLSLSDAALARFGERIL